MKNAKMQALALISCIVAGLIYGLIAYLHQPREKAPGSIDKLTPAAKPETAPAPPSDGARKAAETPVPAQQSAPPPSPAPPPPAPSPAPATETPSPPAMKSVAEPDKSGRMGGPGVDTIQQTPEVMKRLLGDGKKDAVPMANVLASIGVTDSEKSKRELPKVSEAKRAIESLAKAADVAGKLEFLIAKPGIGERMKAFYETAKLHEPDVGGQTADFQIETGGEKYLNVVYQSESRPPGTLHASFVRDEKGVVRLDWESFVGYSATSMKEFREKRSEQPVVMRVLASADDYHNYEFSDSKKFVSIRLRNADGTDAVNGFCETGGRVAAAIGAQLAAAGKAAPPKDGADAAARRVWSPVIVKVRFPTKAQSDHCVELLDLLHDRWLAPAGFVE